MGSGAGSGCATHLSLKIEDRWEEGPDSIMEHQPQARLKHAMSSFLEVHHPCKVEVVKSPPRGSQLTATLQMLASTAIRVQISFLLYRHLAHICWICRCRTHSAIIYFARCSLILERKAHEPLAHYCKVSSPCLRNWAQNNGNAIRSGFRWLCETLSSMCPRVSSRRCAVSIGDEKCLAGRASWSFRVAGAGNRARQLKLLGFVALCEKSAARAWMCEALRNRGRRRESVDLWM